MGPLLKAHPYIALAVSLAICFAAAGFASAYTIPSVRTWYTTIAKPSWQPPHWLFAPVWTVLYAMMAVAAWLVWLRLGNRPGVPAALAVFAIQLAFNTAWSLIFFGMHRPGAALVDIVVLWLAIVLTIVLFWNISRTAAWLLVPYLAWVTFATILNATIWRLNPGAASVQS